MLRTIALAIAKSGREDNKKREFRYLRCKTTKIEIKVVKKNEKTTALVLFLRLK